jgi:hypothetical protein
MLSRRWNKNPITGRTPTADHEGTLLPLLSPERCLITRLTLAAWKIRFLESTTLCFVAGAFYFC